MTTTSRLIADTAFRLHAEGLLPKRELVRIMEQLVNAAALDNGYADRHGLPFPAASPAVHRRLSRRSRSKR